MERLCKQKDITHIPQYKKGISECPSSFVIQSDQVIGKGRYGSVYTATCADRPDKAYVMKWIQKGDVTQEIDYQQRAAQYGIAPPIHELISCNGKTGFVMDQLHHTLTHELELPPDQLSEFVVRTVEYITDILAYYQSYRILGSCEAIFKKWLWERYRVERHDYNKCDEFYRIYLRIANDMTDLRRIKDDIVTYDQSYHRFPEPFPFDASLLSTEYITEMIEYHYEAYMPFRSCRDIFDEWDDYEQGSSTIDVASILSDLEKIRLLTIDLVQSSVYKNWTGEQSDDRYALYKDMLEKLPYDIGEPFVITDGPAVKTLKRKSIAKCIRLFKQLHSLLIAHNDVHEDNIMIQDGHYYLIDFGMASETNEENMEDDLSSVASFFFNKREGTYPVKVDTDYLQEDFSALQAKITPEMTDDQLDAMVSELATLGKRKRSTNRKRQKRNRPNRKSKTYMI